AAARSQRAPDAQHLCGAGRVPRFCPPGVVGDRLVGDADVVAQHRDDVLVPGAVDVCGGVIGGKGHALIEPPALPRFGHRPPGRGSGGPTDDHVLALTAPTRTMKKISAETTSSPVATIPQIRPVTTEERLVEAKG